MFQLCRLILAVSSAIQIRGSNIMLNKPSTQSSTHNGPYESSNANNGRKTGFPSHTAVGLNVHYWQGDLLGFYIIHNISVSSHKDQDEHLKQAFIGVSVHDVSCSGDDVSLCGQWPDQVLPKHTFVYNCSNAGPVRFVRIWRDVAASDALAIQEVEVEGEPASLPEAMYDRFLMKKVSTPIKSLSVTSGINCGTMCLKTQPCLAFSYSPTQQPNCLLATNVTMTSDVLWTGSKIQQCFPKSTCDLNQCP